MTKHLPDHIKEAFAAAHGPALLRVGELREAVRRLEMYAEDAAEILLAQHNPKLGQSLFEASLQSPGRHQDALNYVSSLGECHYL